MKEFGYSPVYTGIENRYFLAVYKDRPEDVWFNICFVNNCEKEIKCLRAESIEYCYDQSAGSNEILAALTSEYENVLPGEYLLLEKLDPLDDRVDEYRYNFNLEVEDKIISIGCSFRRADFSNESFQGMIPIVKEIGRVYLCA